MKIYIAESFSRKEIKELMKVCLVNVSTTAGGVISDCVSSICNNTPLKDINKEAMRIFLAGGISGNHRLYRGSPRMAALFADTENHKRKIIPNYG